MKYLNLKGSSGQNDLFGPVTAWEKQPDGIFLKKSVFFLLLGKKLVSDPFAFRNG